MMYGRDYDEPDETFPEDDAREDGDDWQIDGVGFADPGGRSALRAATGRNPRNLPCKSVFED